jgi:hypothetical protein
MYETTGIGYRIGNISVNSTACADDIPLISEEQNKTIMAMESSTQ